MTDVIESSVVTWTFLRVRALCDVFINLVAGEIHALIGENGAGRPTMVKIIIGFGALSGLVQRLPWAGAATWVNHTAGGGSSNTGSYWGAEQGRSNRSGAFTTTMDRVCAGAGHA